MRIRYPFAGGFAVLFLGAVYMARSDMQMSDVNDKILHFILFFLLTLTLYWAVDLPRRALMKIIFGAAAALSVVSEFAQIILGGRELDPANIAANLLGSFLAVALCQWYHKRMLERKRRRKYGMIPHGEGGAEDDVELGDSPGLHDQQMGVIEEDEDEEEDAWDDMDGGGGGFGDDSGGIGGGGGGDTYDDDHDMNQDAPQKANGDW